MNNYWLLLIDPEVHPQVETYWGNVNPIGPRACYDEGKRVAETMCYAYEKQVSRWFHLKLSASSNSYEVDISAEKYLGVILFYH